VQTTGPAVGPPGYAGLEPTNPPDWHGLVVWDTVFNALATGLFLATAASEIAAPAAFSSIAAWAYPLALVFLFADLTCLTLDLGDPLRFHHMLRVFKPTSPMSLGTWCLTAYSLPLTLLVATDLVGGPSWLHWSLVLIALPCAFGSAMYKGVLFSTTAQPGWRDARWLGANHTSGAILFGCTGLLLIGVISGNAAATTAARPALAVLIVINLVTMMFVVREMASALRRAYAPRPRTTFAALGLVAGVVLPLGLLFVAGATADVAAAVLVLAAGYAARAAAGRLPHAIHAAGPGN
jgi:hypothetical protein